MIKKQIVFLNQRCKVHKAVKLQTIFDFFFVDLCSQQIINVVLNIFLQQSDFPVKTWYEDYFKSDLILSHFLKFV